MSHWPLTTHPQSSPTAVRLVATASQGLFKCVITGPSHILQSWRSRPRLYSMTPQNMESVTFSIAGRDTREKCGRTVTWRAWQSGGGATVAACNEWQQGAAIVTYLHNDYLTVQEKNCRTSTSRQPQPSAHAANVDLNSQHVAHIWFLSAIPCSSPPSPPSLCPSVSLLSHCAFRRNVHDTSEANVIEQAWCISMGLYINEKTPLVR